jgi:hypothetical protein
VFLVNPPLIVIMLALAGRLPADQPAGGQRLDVPGALLVTTSLAALIFGLSNGQQHGFASPVTITALAAALLLSAGFVWVERTAAAPMLPLPILAARTRRAALGAMLMIGAVLAGYVYFVSLYLQKVRDFTPLATGLALVPSTVVVVLTSTLLTRKLLTRFTIKYVLLAGLAAIAAGQLWLTQISDSSRYTTAVLPGLLLTSLGIGLALPTASIAITAGVQGRDQGLAGALFTTGQQIGAAVGLAILATAAAARTARASGSLVAGYQLSFLIATALALLAGVLVAWQLSSRDCQQELARQQSGPGAPPATPAEAQLRKC